MSETISWYFDGDANIEKVQDRIRSCAEVTEITYSHVFIPCEFDGTSLKVRLFNTDPDNWNLYMFPYDSRKIRLTRSSAQLAESIISEEHFFRTFGLPLTPGSQTIPTQCEIKRSKSTGKNTLYVFRYEVCDYQTTKFDLDDVRLEFETLNDIENEFVAEKNYASNVKSVLLKLWEQKDLL